MQSKLFRISERNPGFPAAGSGLALDIAIQQPLGRITRSRLRKQIGRPEQGGIYPFCCLFGGAGRPGVECCLYFSGNSPSCRRLRYVLSLAYASYRFVRYAV